MQVGLVCCCEPINTLVSAIHLVDIGRIFNCLRLVRLPLVIWWSCYGAGSSSGEAARVNGCLLWCRWLVRLFDLTKAPPVLQVFLLCFHILVLKLFLVIIILSLVSQRLFFLFSLVEKFLELLQMASHSIEVEKNSDEAEKTEGHSNQTHPDQAILTVS